MSLAINPEKIIGVCIAGEWFQVERGSFWIDSFEILDVGQAHGGAPGFHFIEDRSDYLEDVDRYGDIIEGPLHAIIAIRRIE